VGEIVDVLKKLLGGKPTEEKKPDSVVKKPTDELWKDRKWELVREKIKSIIKG
jgi:hypothetical protein